MLPRRLEPEALDHLAPDDPTAQRSRRDLRRINRVMGSRRILVRALSRAVPAARAAPLRILEIGCGDGLLMLDVARSARERWPAAELTLLDRQPIVAPETLAAYAAAGRKSGFWKVSSEMAMEGMPSSAPSVAPADGTMR